MKERKRERRGRKRDRGCVFLNKRVYLKERKRRKERKKERRREREEERKKRERGKDGSDKCSCKLTKLTANEPSNVNEWKKHSEFDSEK